MEPQTPLALPPEYNSNRKFLIIIISVFVLLILAGYSIWNILHSECGYLSDCATPEMNINFNLKTYRNEEYGFEFKYPGDWVQQDGVLILKSDLDYASNSDKSDYKNSIFYFIDNTDIDQINPGQSISEYVRNTDVEGTIKSQKDVLVGGINSTQVMGGFDSTVLTTYIPIKKGILSFYIFTNSVSGSDTESLQKVYNQILSTFKFTNNYETFDPDGTLSDISVNKVFGDWIKQTGVSYSVVESSMFSSANIKIQNVFNKTSCNSELKLITSPDGKRTMCFGNAGEPDPDLFLSDKTNNTLSRLASCGTPCIYQSGFWLDDDKFVFLWTMNDYEYENNMKQFYSLNVDMYNLKENKIYSWTTKHLYKN